MSEWPKGGGGGPYCVKHGIYYTGQPDCPACVSERGDAADTLRRLIDLAEDFRGRGIYAEGNAILDAAPAALDAILVERQERVDAIERLYSASALALDRIRTLECERAQAIDALRYYAHHGGDTAIRALTKLSKGGNLMGDPKRGLYNKFVVSRTDGKSDKGEKHDGCRYFVLDLDHDPHAAAAIDAYADSCEEDYPLLAHDLRAIDVLGRTGDSDGIGSKEWER